MTPVPHVFMFRPGLHFAIFAIATLLCSAMKAAGQYSAGMTSTSSHASAQSSTSNQANGFAASVPSGAATNEILRLSLRDAIARALRYNLATIESGENARIVRGQRLVALSKLLPQISAGVSENVDQINLASFGLKLPSVPTVIGPYSYSSADASLSQTLFSYESIQRFRAARTSKCRTSGWISKSSSRSSVAASRWAPTIRGRSGCI